MIDDQVSRSYGWIDQSTQRFAGVHWSALSARDAFVFLGDAMQTNEPPPTAPQQFIAPPASGDGRRCSPETLFGISPWANVSNEGEMTTSGEPGRQDQFEMKIELVLQRAIRARAVVEDMADLVHAMDGALAVSRPVAVSPMNALASRLSLTALQCDLIWSVVACSVDPRIVPHLESLAGAHARRGLSLTTYAQLANLDDASVVHLAEWLASSNALVATGLLLATEQASAAARAYVASPRLVAFLRDAAASIEPLKIVRVDRHLLHDPTQADVLDEIAATFERARAPVIVIDGPSGSGRATACACATRANMIVLECDRIAPEQLDDALVTLRRELLLQSGIPVLANADYLLGDDAQAQRRSIGHFIDRTDGPVVVTVTIGATDLGTKKAIVRATWNVPDTEVRTRLWVSTASTHGLPVEGDVTTIAHRYRVGPAAIERAVASAAMLRDSGSTLDAAKLALGLRHNIAQRLGGLAQQVEVTQTWGDLVISEDVRDLILSLVGRVRHAHQVLDTWGYRKKIARGTGVAALFSGPPGTGKTMAAGLIARELDLELYQVDLSKVVSKWIGETEKNLARVFDAAEEGHALLLFDEADALFGQRSSDMKSANDRYANLEVNYLLQRVEAFGGFTILTTNLETAIDDALKRRLAAHVMFGKPDDDERALLWQRQCTTGSAPVSDRVDYDDLSRVFPNMSGANIRNAALAAAFLAAEERADSITAAHLMRAARAEYRSMGHVLADGLSVGRSQRRSH